MKKKDIIKEEMRRALIKEVATYYVQTQSTFRKTAQVFGMSKSWAQRILQEEIKEKCPELISPVKEVIELNKRERYKRGGHAMAMAMKRRKEISKRGDVNMSKKEKINIQCVKPVIIESLSKTIPMFKVGEIYPLYLGKDGAPSFVRGQVCDLEYEKYKDYFAI